MIQMLLIIGLIGFILFLFIIFLKNNNRYVNKKYRTEYTPLKENDEYYKICEKIIKDKDLFLRSYDTSYLITPKQYNYYWKKSGIYKITYTDPRNNFKKTYVGKSKNISVRIIYHTVFGLGKEIDYVSSKKDTQHIHNGMKRNNIKNYKFEVLKLIYSDHLLNETEEIFIEKLNTYKNENGYNHTRGGEHDYKK